MQYNPFNNSIYVHALRHNGVKCIACGPVLFWWSPAYQHQKPRSYNILQVPEHVIPNMYQWVQEPNVRLYQGPELRSFPSTRRVAEDVSCHQILCLPSTQNKWSSIGLHQLEEKLQIHFACNHFACVRPTVNWLHPVWIDQAISVESVKKCHNWSRDCS